MNNIREIVLRCQGISKTYQDGKLITPVLTDVTLAIGKGERVAIVGSSGSGKSTLMHLLGGLDTPSQGEVELLGQAFSRRSANERGMMRNQYLGFVYQFHHLLPEFTALENAAMPLLIAGKSVKFAKQEARKLLTEVGLQHRLHHKPSELSGGERQRVAIARAMVSKPLCILADEPTGNLDRHAAERVYQLLLGMNQEFGTSIVLVTHDLALAKKMDRILCLDDGRIQPSNDKGI